MQVRNMIVATLVVTLMALTGGAMLAGSPRQQPAGWGPDLFSVPAEASDRIIPALTSQTGPGAVITVTTTNPAANPGDGDCSLIEAINNANADADTSGGDCPAGAGPDTIQLAAIATYTLSVVDNITDGSNGLPSITSTAIVQGNGSIIERSSAGGTPAFRLVHVAPGAELTLYDLTLRNGLISGGLDGGGIRNQGGTLILDGCIVSNNSASGVGSDGGGIYNRAEGHDATTVLMNSQVISNTTTRTGGGLVTVTSSNFVATLTISNSLVSQNWAGEAAGGIYSTRVSGSTNYGNFVNVLASEVSHNVTTNSMGVVGGGGMINNYAEWLISDSIISHNRAETGSAFGGGMINTLGNATIVRSVFNNNVASSAGGPFPAGGGGIVNADGALTIANSTFSGNVASGGANGGALLLTNFFSSAPSEVVLVNNTISNNSADAAGGAAAAIDLGAGQPISGLFINTIVASNPAADARNCTPMQRTVFVSGGHNLEDLDTCAFNQPGDQVNTNPLLGPLQNNGGPTRTHALLPASPAIDAGDDAVCQAPPVTSVDQRGVGRPVGLSCDKGAYEAEAPTAVELTGLQPGVSQAKPDWPLVALAILLALPIAGVAQRRRTTRPVSPDHH